MIWLMPLALAMRLAPANAAEPYRQPQLAARENVVAMVFGSGHSIWFSKSIDRGGTFSRPVKIAEQPALALGRHRGPRIVFSGPAMIVSAVFGSTVATGEHAHGLPADGNLLVWRSQDEGRTWSKPVVVNDVPSSAREGLHAMAADPDGRLQAVWLDLRAKGTRLYTASSTDAGATWSKNMLAYESPDGTICECCDPSIASLGHDEFAVMWRNWLGGNRDMYTIRLKEGKLLSPPERQGSGNWKLNACPMDGGGLAVDNGKLVSAKLVSAWRRDERVYLARPGNPEVEVGRGKDVAIAAGDKGIYVAWVGDSGIEVRQPGESAPVRLAKNGAFPALTTLADGSILAAWEEDGAIVTRRLEIK